MSADLNTNDTPAARKNALIAQGARYRSGITISKNVVQSNLHMDVLAKSAVQHVAARSSAVLGALLSLNSLRKGNLGGLLPLVTTGVSLLSKRGAVKPLLRGGALLAVAGAAAFFMIRKKRAARSAANAGATQDD
jgi:hypothetical protein